MSFRSSGEEVTCVSVDSVNHRAWIGASSPKTGPRIRISWWRTNNVWAVQGNLTIGP